jgi:uncharacterized membrane protein required for colicin V production
MTWLDAGVVVFILLVGLGGYYQGLLRGLTRTIALLGTGLIALTLSLGAAIGGTLEGVVVRTLALVLAVVLVVGVITWSINRVIPRSFHHSPVNRVLGVVPAVLQGVIVVALVLGFVHRVAFDQATQRYIEQGRVTGPLIVPFSWIERSLSRLP